MSSQTWPSSYSLGENAQKGKVLALAPDILDAEGHVSDGDPPQAHRQVFCADVSGARLARRAADKAREGVSPR